MGDHYWEMKGSCRTGKRDEVADLIKKYARDPEPKPLGNAPVTLKKQNVYLFKADLREAGAQIVKML